MTASAKATAIYPKLLLLLYWPKSDSCSEEMSPVSPDYRFEACYDTKYTAWLYMSLQIIGRRLRMNAQVCVCVCNSCSEGCNVGLTVSAVMSAGGQWTFWKALPNEDLSSLL